MMASPEELLINAEDRAELELELEPLFLSERELTPLLRRLPARSAAVVLARAQGALFTEIASELRLDRRKVGLLYRRAVSQLRLLVAHPVLAELSEEELRDTVHSMGVRLKQTTIVARFLVTSCYVAAARKGCCSFDFARRSVLRVVAQLQNDGYGEEPVVCALAALVQCPYCLQERRSCA